MLGLPSRRPLVGYGSSLLSLGTSADIYITHGYRGVTHGTAVIPLAGQTTAPRCLTTSSTKGGARDCRAVLASSSLSRSLGDHRVQGDDVSQALDCFRGWPNSACRTLSGPQLSHVGIFSEQTKVHSHFDSCKQRRSDDHGRVHNVHPI